VVGWLDGDPGFVAGLNRARACRAERLRAEVRSLTSEAVATRRELVSGPDVPPSVRPRSPPSILQAADAMKAEAISSTSARGVRVSMDHRALIRGLGGGQGIERSPVSPNDRKPCGDRTRHGPEQEHGRRRPVLR
jgi:hypothetical protein